MASTLATGPAGNKVPRRLNARPDTLDFRDRMFESTLIEVPLRIPLKKYLVHKIPILDQGQEGACTGFGLATVANYLLTRRKVDPDRVQVSARMLYEMARRYDEWPGQDYSGSSARGAMKGWQKHGICEHEIWKSLPAPAKPAGMNDARTADALRRPLGAYLRVNHKDLVAMHSALAEVGMLYATATVHEGWDYVGGDGLIPYPAREAGGHAFAIVAYDEKGFWIQNSWGTGWGQGGFAQISYDDWLANGTDVWVARLGAPVVLRLSASSAIAHSAAAARSSAYAYSDLRPHIVSLGNDGRLRAGGDYGTSAQELEDIFKNDIPRAMADWPKDARHVLLYAHGGLVDERSAIQRLADYRSELLKAHIYPISFIWHSDYWSTLTNILQDAMRRRRAEGVLGAAKDFLLDRLDDTLEIVARGLTGKAAWDQMKQNALAASSVGGGALLALDYLAQLRKTNSFKLHVVGHSAGSIFHAPLVRLLTAPVGKIGSGYLRGRQGYGMDVDTCTLWAPACSTALFKDAYLPAVKNKKIGRLALFAMNDKAERDDHCAKIYNKSLLYLVSRAFEDSAIGAGTPVLGMEKWLAADPELSALFVDKAADIVFSPNSQDEGTMWASRSTEHGGFDDDDATVKATLARIVATGGVAVSPEKAPDFQFHRSSSSMRGKRETLDRNSRAPA